MRTVVHALVLVGLVDDTRPNGAYPGYYAVQSERERWMSQTSEEAESRVVGLRRMSRKQTSETPPAEQQVLDERPQAQSVELFGTAPVCDPGFGDSP